MNVDISLDRDDFWHFHRFHYLHTKPGRLTLLLFALIIPFTAFVMDVIDRNWTTAAGVVTLVTSVLWWLVLPWLLKRLAWIAFRRFPEHFKMATLSISDRELVWRGPLTTDMLAWPAISRMARDGHAFYFYIDVQRAFIVPRQAFARPEDAEAFWEAAQSYQRESLASRQAV